MGDIHGQLDLLRRAHDRIATDRARHGPGAAPVVHLGDLVDRGPDPARVIAYLIAGIAAGQDWLALMGNHDRAFSVFLDDPAGRKPGLGAELSWQHPRIGGVATLAADGGRGLRNRGFRADRPRPAPSGPELTHKAPHQRHRCLTPRQPAAANPDRG